MEFSFTFCLVQRAAAEEAAAAAAAKVKAKAAKRAEAEAAAAVKKVEAAAAKEAARAEAAETAQLQDLCTFMSAAGTDTSLQLAAEMWQYQQQTPQEKAARTPDESKRYKLLSSTANKRKRYAEDEEGSPSSRLMVLEGNSRRKKFY